MWEQTKKSPQVKMLILMILVILFIPFSYLWHGQLTNFKCQEHGIANYSSIDGDQNCIQKIDMHWALFYGINGMVYGVPLLTVVLKSKR